MSTRLKDAIEGLLLAHGSRARPSFKSETQRIAEKLPEGMGELRPPTDPDAMSKHLAEALTNGVSLTGRQLQNCSSCLWTTKVAIAERASTLQPFLNQLRKLRHKPATRTLALSYLSGFSADRPGLSEIAGALRDLINVMGDPFATLQRDLRIFDEAEGARRIGDASFKKRTSPRSVLEAHGLRQELVLSGDYVEPCARRVLERIADDSELPALERLSFVTSIAVKDDRARELHFPSHKALVGNALLLPYRERNLKKDIRDEILNFLVSLKDLGDPRTKRANWVNMPEAQRVAISWLTEQALRQFLDVVGAVNPNENWKYRRKFWETMYENEVITEAWVVLDREGASEARDRFGDNASFGQFGSGSGIQIGHAVLLLRIGRGICAEWSYNGKCRFWADAERRGAPNLYDARYDADELRTGNRYAPVLEVIHSAHTGENAWQHKVANQIKSMTGARFSRQDYML